MTDIKDVLARWKTNAERYEQSRFADTLCEQMLAEYCIKLIAVAERVCASRCPLALQSDDGSALDCVRKDHCGCANRTILKPLTED